MATQANVSLRFVMSGANSVIGIMDRISGKKRDLERPADIPIKADDTDAQSKFDRVRGEVADLNRLVAKATLTADDAPGMVKVKAFQIELRKLNDYVARPTITDRGLDSAELRALKLLATLKEIDRTKSTFSISSLISKIPGLGGFGGGSSGSGGVIESAASGGGINPLMAIANPLSSGALTNPWVLGGIAGLAPFLGTAAGGALTGALGAGLAGTGILGAIMGSQNSANTPANKAALTAAQDKLTAAQQRAAAAQATLNQLQSGGGASSLTLAAAQLRVVSAQDRLNQLESSGKATASQLASAKATLASAQANLVKVQTGGVSSATQLANAHANLASAQGSVITSQAALNKLQDDATTSAPQLAAAIKDLGDNIVTGWEAISTPFQGALMKIIGAGEQVLPKVLKPLGAAFQAMAGPVGDLGVAIASSFGSPAVATAIKTVGQAFDTFLKAFTPQVPVIANALANGITGMASAFTDHPDMIKGMVAVVTFLLELPGYVAGALGSLTRVSNWLLFGLPHDVSIGLDDTRKFFIDIGHSIETAWDATFGAITGAVQTALSWIGGHWPLLVAIMTGPVGIVVAGIIKYWADIKAPFVDGYNFIIGIYRDITNWVSSNFDKWWVENGDAIKQLWQEIWATVRSTVSEYWTPIAGVIKVGWSTITDTFTSSWDTIRGVMTAGWAVVRGIFVGGIDLIKVVWDVGWATVEGTAKVMWLEIQDIIKVGWEVITLLFKASIGILVASWQIFWAMIYNVAKVTWTLVKDTLKGIWDIIVGIFSVFINLITGHWSAALDAMKDTAIQVWNLTKENLDAIWTAIKNIGIAIWDSLKAYFIALWDDLKKAAITSWTDTKNTIVSIWDNVVSTGKTIWNDFFGWLRDGWTNVVRSAGSIWNGIKDAVSSPVKWVAHNVLSPLFRGIDAVTNFVHLGNPLAGAVSTLSGMAAGGKINVGTHGTADDVLIRVSKNETVLSEAHSKFLAPLLGQIGVPGYASGGLVNPIGPGLRPERVDMGVDYGGFGPLYALGSGTIVETSNSGWPGGTFVDLRLNPPYGSGYWYYAEDIMPAVYVGQSVSAGQLIGHAWGGPSGIEVGWASGRGGETMAAAQGQQNKGGDPGAFPTAWGVSASNLIGSLGGPRGIVSGPIHGGTAGIGSIIETVQQIFSGLGKFAKTAIAIAGGNLGGAVTDLLGLVAHGAGGAGGMLGETLLKIPGTMASDAIHYIVNAVKHFVSGQQAASGGMGVAAVGPLQDYAKKLVDAKWGDAYWPYFEDIVRRESGWNIHATNPSSGAYGIPQALPGDKMASAGADWRTNGYTQLRWMVGYLASRWGNPLNADVNEQKNHWYAYGTDSTAPGWAMVGERGPELVRFSGGQQVIPNDQIGGVTYVINVRPSPLARPADIGREVVGAIREYEKRSGKGWRS